MSTVEDKNMVEVTIKIRIDLNYSYGESFTKEQFILAVSSGEIYLPELLDEEIGEITVDGKEVILQEKYTKLL